MKSTSPPVRIMIVDRDSKQMAEVKKHLESFGYFCTRIDSRHQALDVLSQDPHDLVIMDIKGSEKGIGLLRKITQAHPSVAVIIITGSEDTRKAVKCLKIGAYDYVIKPLSRDAIQIVVTRALERRNLLLEKDAYRMDLEKQIRARTFEVVHAYHEIEKTYQQTLEALVSALDFREQSTAGHSKRTVEYTRLLAMELGFKGEQLVHITRGALLHDVGKIGISDAILLKPGKLTAEEWQVMRMHPIYGYQMLKDIKFLEPSLNIVLHHHERFDGTGYPNGLSGQTIPIGARIFSVVDAFDAITSSRVYRAAQGFEKAYEVLKEHVGDQFDPDVVAAFLRLEQMKIMRIHQLSLLEESKGQPVDSLLVPNRN